MRKLRALALFHTKHAGTLPTPGQPIQSAVKTLVLLLLITLAAIAVEGYHPGIEDDGVYLAAIHRDLNPALYPHDAEFFKLQLQATVFDKLIASSVRLTRLPLPAVLLMWQTLTIFLVLLGCYAISRRCFSEYHAQWAAVCTVAALLTIPVAGTALYIIDQYLHPRALATAALLFGIVAILNRRYWRASLLLLIACVIHPLMGSFGVSYCVFLGMKRIRGLSQWSNAKGQAATAASMIVFPLAWVLEPVNASWRAAANTRDYYFLSRWTWYEWLGVIAPLFLIYGFSRLARRKGWSVMERMNQRLVGFGVFQLLVAVVIMLPSRLERFRAFQPMRYLHLLYLLFLLFAGGVIGQWVLRRSAVRWVLFFVPLCAGMFIAQRKLFPNSSHLELTPSHPRNEWVQAFDWARDNTPTNALFGLDPNYMEARGEDYHSFRALAERSALADYVKDAAVVTQVPELAPRWQREVDAEKGWKNFQLGNFKQLKTEYDVTWVLLSKPVTGLQCPYRNPAVAVCRID